MSKYGSVNVNVYDHFTSDQLQARAQQMGITYEQCVSLAHEFLYRKEYMRLRNRAPEVKATRKAYNKQRAELMKQL